MPRDKEGRGNPLNAKAQRLRAACLGAVSSSEVRAVVKKLVAMAVEGDVAAARLVLSYTLGKPADFDPLGG